MYCRELSQIEDSVALARLIESCGVAALTVHGRTVTERPQHRNRDETIRAISQAVKIPVIAKCVSPYRFHRNADHRFLCVCLRNGGRDCDRVIFGCVWIAIIVRLSNMRT